MILSNSRSKLQSRIIEWVLGVLRVLFQGFIPASLDYAKDMTVRVRTLQAELQMLLLLFVRVLTSLSTIFQSYHVTVSVCDRELNEHIEVK